MRQAIGRGLLGLLGWKTAGNSPAVSHCILVAAPHTSNWDLPYMLASAWAFDLRVAYLAKHTIFKGPQGWLFRKLGGIAVDRRKANNLVDAVTSEFARTEQLALVIAPEATRGRVEHWKSGFYFIAKEAGVPIVPTKLDFSTRTATIGEAFEASDSAEADMDRLREFYDGCLGKFPEHFGPVRLAKED